MNLRIALVISITCAGLLGPAAPAAAQDAALAQAEQHFNRAQALYQEGKYEEAAVEFQAAYQARALPPFLFNIGASFEKLAKAEPGKIENWDKAISYYSKYLEADPKAEDGKAIQERIKVLESERQRIKDEMASSEEPKEMKPSAKVEALEEVTIRGLVVIESEPSSAFIYLDNKKKGPLGKTPWSGTIEGAHTIYLERKGYKPREMAISPSPDKLLVLSFALAEEDYLGWIEITSNVPGADIYIDDKAVGVFAKTPFSGNLKPGKHRIWITSEGYDEYAAEVDVVAGQTHAVTARLEGAPVGYISVRGKSTEKATIYLDGEVLCKRGPCRKAVRQGKHTVEVKRPGYKSYRRTVELEAKTEISMDVKLAKKPGRGDAVWAYAFSAAFAGGGVYLGLRSQSLHDELKVEIEQGAPPPDSSDPRIKRGKYFTIGADVAYGLAGITFLTAIYYTLRDKGPPSSGSVDIRALSLQPQLAPGYAGLGMEVTW
jgi:tetratricopeptide (TPR) repeat protein